jgi:D-alanine-D-alanine ligase
MITGGRLETHAALIGAALTEIRDVTEKVAAILVISVRDQTVIKNDYANYSIAAGFLQSFEIDEFTSSLRSSGFYVEHFYDEADFIAWVLSGGYQRIPHEFKLLYSSAANGTGPGRPTLIPAFAALMGLATANSDAHSCAINRHKFHCARLLKELGYPVPRTWSYEASSGWFHREQPDYGTMVIAKATFEDSSLGVSTQTVGEFSASLESNIADASRDLRQPMTVQEFIFGDEFEVPVLEIGQLVAPSPIAVYSERGLRNPEEVLLYDEVFDDGYLFAEPTGYDHHQLADISRLAVSVASTLGFRGFSRVDFRIDGRGKPFIIDVAVTPHLTRASSYHFLFSLMGFSYADMLAAMIASGVKLNYVI